MFTSLLEENTTGVQTASLSQFSHNVYQICDFKPKNTINSIQFIQLILAFRQCIFYVHAVRYAAGAPLVSVKKESTVL